uniref:Gustatory receptor n=1 Tax=Tetranychus urticae TaxID=32264 RepID=T1K9H9_TETUR
MDSKESIVTKGFLVKYNLMLSPFPRWFIIFTLGLCGLIKNTRYLIPFLSSSFSSASKSIEFNTIRYAIYIVILLSRGVIVTFGLDWKAFAAYTEQLSRVELDKDEESVKRIDRERRIKNCVCFFALLSYIMITISRSIPRIRMEVNYLFILLNDIIILISNFYLIYLIIDLSICLKAAFRFINHHLEHFKITSPNSMLPKLRQSRLLYSCAVRASQEAEKFARHYIAWCYFHFFLLSIVNIVEILSPKGVESIAFVLFMAFDIINTGYLTLNLVAVNSVSTEGMEDLYEISYDLKSYNLQNENNLFLNRMLWQNVGFTFSNLFLINPNFITSLLSFSLTIAIMIANFLYS